MPQTTAMLRRYAPGHALTYGVYAAVGAVVGIVAIATRETVAVILPTDTPLYYVLSVVATYVICISLSYCGHSRFTFRARRFGRGGATGRRFSQFAAVACLGLVATAALSVGIRYGLDLDEIAGEYGAGLAFVLAALLASVLTYALNFRYTFGPHPGATIAAGPPRATGAVSVRPRRRSPVRPQRDGTPPSGSRYR